MNGVSCEYMYCSLLGVTKNILCMWTDLARSRHTLHSIHADIATTDKSLSCISVTSEICRKPRGVIEVKHWKSP